MLQCGGRRATERGREREKERVTISFKDYFVGGPSCAIHLKVLEMKEQLVSPAVDGFSVASRVR